MHENLILNIITKKLISIHETFERDFQSIYPFLSGEKAYLADYNTQNDCGCSINIYFKHLENTDDEGVVLYVHIPKVMAYKIEIQLMLMKSNGMSFCTDNFYIDLKSEKSKRCKVVNDLFNAMGGYYVRMQQIIKEEYLPRQ